MRSSRVTSKLAGLKFNILRPTLKVKLNASVIAIAKDAELHALRMDFKNRSSPDAQETIVQGNLECSGDKLGPTLEFLINEGKDWQDIIESTAGPGRGEFN